MRGQQQRQWMYKMVQDELMTRFETNDKVKLLAPQLEKQVEEGVITPSMAADQLLAAFLNT